jgi:transcriptional regulator with XRE-family HTH domain
MDLGNAIKTLRKHKKITQKQLAELSGISTNALCSIETGQSYPSMTTIKKICSSLNVPESYLLLFSITEDDIPEGKKILYRTLCEPLREELIHE